MRHMDVEMNMVIMPAMQHWTALGLVLVFVIWAVMMKLTPRRQRISPSSSVGR